MVYQDIIRFVHALEEQKEYSKIVVGEHDIWPIIRTTIGYNLHRTFNLKKEENVLSEEKKKGKEQKNKMLRIISAFSFYLLSPMKKIVVFQSLKKKYHQNFKFGTPASQSIWIVGYNHHRLESSDPELNGYNQFSDPFAELANSISEKVNVIDLFWGNSKLKQAQNYKPILVGDFQFIWQDWYKLIMRNKFKTVLDSLTVQIKKMNSKIDAVGLKQEMEGQILNYFIYLKIWTKVLGISKPKALVVYNYYNPSIFALCSVAKGFDIPVIECQHSAISDFHFAYGMWLNTPEKGYSMFPTYFWVWKESDFDLINRNFNANGKNYDVCIGGYLWLEKWINQLSSNDSYSTKTKVLISLQGLGIPQFIVEAIDKLDNSIIWHFRLHPRYPYELETCQKLAAENENIELELANHPNFYKAVSTVDYHLTFFSGTALEAYEFGVQNIITGDAGKEVFSEQLKAGLFLSANSSDELIHIIRNKIKSPENIRQKYSEIVEPKVIFNRIINEKN